MLIPLTILANSDNHLKQSHQQNSDPYNYPSPSPTKFRSTPQQNSDPFNSLSSSPTKFRSIPQQNSDPFSSLPSSPTKFRSPKPNLSRPSPPPKVEDLRQELSTCLSTCMHWIYLLSLILVIAVCFNCLSGTTSLSGLFKLLHTPVFFLLFTCQAAQRFSEKVPAGGSSACA